MSFVPFPVSNKKRIADEYPELIWYIDFLDQSKNRKWINLAAHQFPIYLFGNENSF